MITYSEPPDVDASYDDELGSDKDKIRREIADTDMSQPLFSDAHITALLSLRSTISATVAALATELVMRYGREPVHVTTNGLTVDFTERLGVWRSLMSAQSGGVASGQLTYPTFHPTPTADSITRGWRPD